MYKNIIKVFILFFLSFAIFMPIEAEARAFPNPQGYVTDETNTLSSEQEQNLESKLQNFENSTTNEIAILMISSLEGENLEDYANRLFENWGIGQKDKDNGILILVAKEERKIRIEVGYGLEGSVNDAYAGDIIREKMSPEFKQNNFYQGLDNATNALIKRIDANYASENNIQSEDSFSEPEWMKIVFSNVFGNLFICLALLLSFVLPYMGAFLARSKSWWLGGIIGLVSGIIIAGILSLFFAGIIAFFCVLPFILGIWGLLLDYRLSKNFQKLEKQGKPTDFWSTVGGIYTGSNGWSMGRSGSGSSGGGSFGGGSSGGGGASGGW